MSREDWLIQQVAGLEQQLEAARAEADWLRLQLRTVGLVPEEPPRLRERDVDTFLERSFAAVDEIRRTPAPRQRVTVENTD